MDLYDVEFSKGEMEETVLPLRQIAVAFGDALFTTIHEARKPHGEASKGRKKAYEQWSKFADLVCAFAKE